MNRPEQSNNVYKMLSIALLCLFAGLGIGYYIAKNPVRVFEPQGCTMEAKICPDGSAVGRTGPKCEFSPCPPETRKQPQGDTNTTTNSGRFSKRLFDPNGTIIETAPFPKEMTKISDSALVGLQCSGFYYNYGNGGFLMETESGSKEMTDALLLDVASKHPTISALSSCRTETGGTIVHYEIEAGAAGAGNTSSFFTLETDGSLKKISSISNDGAPYFICSRPYMLTDKNIVYWGCGGGDGGFGQSSVYAIDLNTSSTRRVIKCTSTADSESADPGGPSTVKCE